MGLPLWIREKLPVEPATICPPACMFCAGMISDGICLCGEPLDDTGFCMNKECPHCFHNYCDFCGGNNELVGRKDCGPDVVACECDID